MVSERKSVSSLNRQVWLFLLLSWGCNAPKICDWHVGDFYPREVLGVCIVCLQGTLADGTLHRNFMPGFGCCFNFKLRKSKVFKFIRWEQSHFYWNLTSSGEEKQEIIHSICWIRSFQVANPLSSSTSELQSGIPTAQEQWKPKCLVTGRRWGVGDVEACKLSIPQGLTLLSGWWGLPIPHQPDRRVNCQAERSPRMGFLVLQLERQAGRRPGEDSSQVLLQVHLQLNCLKEEFYFWRISSSSAGRRK